MSRSAYKLLKENGNMEEKGIKVLGMEIEI